VIIAVIGKGGVGKTTVTALLLRRLIEGGETPVLAIDADPSSCLGAALGLAVDKTLADMRDGLREGERPSSMSSAEWLALRTEEALVESTGFDLLTMGHPEGKRCYCFVNNLIRDRLDRLARAYRHVLVDCEAGLEHLSRRTAGRPDALLCVTNRSRMGAQTIARALALYRNLHGELPEATDLVLNQYDADEPLAADMQALAAGSATRFRRVLVLPADPQVAGAEASGRALLDLAPTTPALSALRAWQVPE
jgi:CO dehydrogenase maturation factor